MAGIVGKSFEDADEVRTPPKTRVDVVQLGNVTAGRLTAQPGWRWSECIKPVVGGESCQVHHVGLVMEGAMHVVHDDGTELDLVPGHAYVIEPGHDAWVVGDQALVAYEFDATAAATFAKPS